MNLNWHNIRPINNSLNDGFEELVCQLARKESIKNAKKFVRKGKPDAGVECYWILENDREWAWQAKYFTASLNDNQWGQIDKSVKTVLEKHPNTQKYFIAIPIDPADARKDKETSMLEKWNVRIEKWKNWAKEKNLNVEFLPWWSSDLISRLQKPKNSGLTYFWFNKEDFTNEWFKEQVEIATINLGNRYSPKLNFELDIAKIFDGIARDEYYENRINEIFDALFIKAKKVTACIKEDDFTPAIEELKELIFDLYNEYTQQDFKGISKIPFQKIENKIEKTESLTEDILNKYRAEEEKAREGKKEYQYSQKYADETYQFRNLASELRKAHNFILDDISLLVNKPVLIIDGKAGIGKSHLLADVANKRISENKPCLLLLGQQLNQESNPWQQILSLLNLNCKLDEFLGALNSKAQIQNSRIIIFIDAINEGRGRYFWPTHIRGFIKKVSAYKWLGLVLSIRTSYNKLIVPKESVLDNLIIRHTHFGFHEVEYEASKLFFKNYQIQLPAVPLLHPEFQNPLFLKIFCEGISRAGLSKIPDGFQGISKILSFFLKTINNKLSQPNHFNYPSNINLVDKALKELIKYKLESDSYFIPFETAFTIIHNLQKTYGINGNFIDSLISEGVISKNLRWKENDEHDESIYIAYERFEDHLSVSFLLDSVDKESLKNAFDENGKFFKYVQGNLSYHKYRGFWEALSIQLPEKFDTELYEVITDDNKSFRLAESFVSSLLWRKHSTITNKILSFVNEVVLMYKGTRDDFFDTVIATATLPSHFFNAVRTHNFLIQHSMSERDASWTQMINNWYSDSYSLKRLIDWAWSDEDKGHISDESIRLASMMLGWFLTSTNRTLRDCASKGLIALLENRIEVLIKVLKNFEEVNDPYIFERIYGVTYGCALRTNEVKKLSQLSQYVYTTIFDKEKVYPNILLRDYARGIIEYTLYLKQSLDLNESKIRPPYQSDFPDSFPNDEETDKYLFDYKSPNFKDYYWAQNKILRSMITEYGRGVSGYGDFGRYVFERSFRPWKVDANDLSNWAVKKIFEEYGYDVEKHGEFDRQIDKQNYDRYSSIKERIGKKYQWIALYEILARVSDNFDAYKDNWGDEKQAYTGPWEPNVRDFEPTILIKESLRERYDVSNNNWWFNFKYINWNCEHIEWMKNDMDLPSVPNLIEKESPNGDKWIHLDFHPIWTEPKLLGQERSDRLYKRIWYQLSSYLVKNKDFETFKKWGIEKDFRGIWMPTSNSRHELFSREYYWSPGYKFFQKEYYEGLEKQKVYDNKTRDFIGTVVSTTEHYIWEAQYDASKEDSISFIRPAKLIFEKLNLQYSKSEGEFLKDGKLVCFDPSVNRKSLACLLIKKDLLLQFLKDNDLRIFWTFMGEKQVLGDHRLLREHNINRLEVSGFYHFQNEKIIGNSFSSLT